jgi:uncharacterized membrane protein
LKVFEKKPKMAVEGWETLALTVVASLIFSISILTDLPWLPYLRIIFSLFFFLFAPGFAFIKLFFGVKHSNNLDYIEVFGVSVGISITLVLITGLALVYTPWGICLESLTITLLIMTVIFASAAVFRETVN